MRAVHRQVRIRLDYADPQLAGSAPGGIYAETAIRLVNDGQSTVSQIPLLLYRLCKVESAEVRGARVELEQRISEVRGFERLHVNAFTVALPDPVEPGQACELRLVYGGVIAGAREAWQYVWDCVSRDYTLLRPDVLWYPAVGGPDAGFLGSYYQPFTYDLAVGGIPGGFTAVAAGQVGTGEGEAVFACEVPRSRMDLAVARFDHVPAGELEVYHLPGYENWGRAAVECVAQAVQALSRLLGGRSIGGLTVAQIPDGWGSQSTPGLILQQAGPPGEWSTTMRQLVHEVAHFWTPASADWPNRFVNEGLATYLQIAVTRELVGNAAAESELERSRRALLRRPEVEGISLLRKDVPDGLHGLTFYTKGALAFAALEELLGPEAFWPLLREFASAGERSAQDLVDLVRARHPGPETERYLRRWFGE